MNDDIERLVMASHHAVALVVAGQDVDTAMAVVVAELEHLITRPEFDVLNMIPTEEQG